MSKYFDPKDPLGWGYSYNEETRHGEAEAIIDIIDLLPDDNPAMPHSVVKHCTMGALVAPTLLRQTRTGGSSLTPQFCTKAAMARQRTVALQRTAVPPIILLIRWKGSRIVLQQTRDLAKSSLSTGDMVLPRQPGVHGKQRTSRSAPRLPCLLGSSKGMTRHPQPHPSPVGPLHTSLFFFRFGRCCGRVALLVFAVPYEICRCRFQFHDHYKAQVSDALSKSCLVRIQRRNV